MRSSPAILLCALAAASATCRDDAPPPSPVPMATAPADASGAALPPGHPPIAAAGGGAAPADAVGVSGRITLAPRLQAQVPPRHALFLIARDAQRTIVAVRREESVTYPFSFRISAADAMTDGTKFAGPLEITARISRAGDAIPSAGDLEGVARGVAVGASDVPITIDTTRK